MNSEMSYLIKKGTTLYVYKNYSYFDNDIRKYPFVVKRIFKDEKKESYKVEFVSFYYFCYQVDPRLKKFEYEPLNFYYKKSYIVSLDDIGTKYKVKDQINTEFVNLRIYKDATIYGNDGYCLELTASKMFRKNNVNTSSIIHFFECDIKSIPILKDYYTDPDTELSLLNLLDDKVPEYKETKIEFKKSSNDFLKKSKIEDTSHTNIFNNTTFKNTDRFLPYCNIIELDRNGINSININEINNIYYFTKYYPKDICEEYNNPYYWKDYNRVIDFKNGKFTDTDSPERYFKFCLNKHLSSLSEEWIVCSMPGHAQVQSTKNPVNNMLKNYKWNKNLIIVPDVFIRIKAENYAKHDKMYGERDYTKDLKTLAINSKHNLKGKNVIVIDDVVTSGSSFIAAKKLLLDVGVNKIMFFALARTVNRNDLNFRTKKPEYSFDVPDDDLPF